MIEHPGPMDRPGIRVIRYNENGSIRVVEHYDAGSAEANHRVDRLLSLADNADFKQLPKIAASARELISELCGGGARRPLWMVDLDIDALNVAMGEADKDRVETTLWPLARKHQNSANGYKSWNPKPKPENDDKLCEDAAGRFLKTSGENRVERAQRAVAHVLENNDYSREYKVGRDRAVTLVKRGLEIIGKSSEWPERAYPKNRKSKFPPTR